MPIFRPSNATEMVVLGGTGRAEYDEETRKSRTFREETDFPLPRLGWHKPGCWDLRRTYLQVCVVTCTGYFIVGIKGRLLGALRAFTDPFSTVFLADVVFMLRTNPTFAQCLSSICAGPTDADAFWYVTGLRVKSERKNYREKSQKCGVSRQKCAPRNPDVAGDIYRTRLFPSPYIRQRGQSTSQAKIQGHEDRQILLLSFYDFTVGITPAVPSPRICPQRSVGNSRDQETHNVGSLRYDTSLFSYFFVEDRGTKRWQRQPTLIICRCT